jgi:hypothetical protein
VRLHLAGFASLVLAASCSSVRWRPDPEDDPRDLYRFTRASDFTQVKISLEGTYAGALSTPQGRGRLSFIRCADRAIVGGLDLDKEESVISFDWVSDTRLVLELGRRPDGPLDVPFSTGEMLAVDMTGGNPRMIYGSMKRLHLRRQLRRLRGVAERDPRARLVPLRGRLRRLRSQRAHPRVHRPRPEAGTIAARMRASAAMCSGVVPQQPPITETPSSAHRAACST